MSARLRGSLCSLDVDSSKRCSPVSSECTTAVFVFDGAGKLTGKQSSSRGGKIGREKLEGSYTLDPDCTGTLTLGGILAGQTHWDLYVTEDRKRGHIIRLDQGNMAVVVLSDNQDNSTSRLGFVRYR